MITMLTLIGTFPLGIPGAPGIDGAPGTTGTLGSTGTRRAGPLAAHFTFTGVMTTPAGGGGVTTSSSRVAGGTVILGTTILHGG